MKDKAITFALFLIIVAQVYYIFFHNPQIYQQYYHVLIIIPATVAAYLLVIYSRRKLNHLAKPNPIMTPEEYERHVKEQSRQKVDELLRSEGYRKFEAIKEGRLAEEPISEDRKKQQDEILEELEAMENSIFEDE